MSVETSAAAPPDSADSNGGSPLISVEHLKVFFPIKQGIVIDREVGRVHAVNDVTLSIDEGETLGLVGESGCGKTTMSRTIMRLIDATEGTIRYRGDDITKAGHRQMAPLRREMQMVFQDPFASLNPRKRVGQIIGMPLKLHGTKRKDIDPKVRELLDRVGLHPEHINRFPHEFSGGQRQRIGVARALALEPRLVVLDEPVSALDVSIRAGVINLLEELREKLSLSYLFVAHDLSVVRHIANRVAVMYLGRIVEIGDVDHVFDAPAHPYTQALLSAIPLPDPRKERERRRIVLEGDLPSPADPPSGCRFRTRCPLYATLSGDRAQRCNEEDPGLTTQGADHGAACHYPQVKTVL